MNTLNVKYSLVNTDQNNRKYLFVADKMNEMSIYCRFISYFTRLYPTCHLKCGVCCTFNISQTIGMPIIYLINILSGWFIEAISIIWFLCDGIPAGSIEIFVGKTLFNCNCCNILLITGKCHTVTFDWVCAVFNSFYCYWLTNLTWCIIEFQKRAFLLLRWLSSTQLKWQALGK